MNYQEAKERLETPRKKDSKIIANNTILHTTEDGGIAVQLHATDVITFYPDGSVIYNTGGWNTVTTRERMNTFGSREVWVCQQKGIPHALLTGEEKGIPFRETFSLSTDHKSIISDMNGSAIKKHKNLLKKINQYTNRFVEKILKKEVPPPSSGDCLYCQFREVKMNVSLGESTKNKEHILSHLDEAYYVPSLFVRAIEKYPLSMISNTILSMLWNPEDDQYSQNFIDKMSDVFTQQARSSLKKYLKEQLGV